MNIELLKKLGNVEQMAGIREAQLLRGRGQGIQIAEFHNAAGLRFTVVPDRCMDIFDFSYKGINLSFQGKTGLTSPHAYIPNDGEFPQQWPAGMLVTCGLDNVGGHTVTDATYPTHGRISHIPATNFGTSAHWEGDRYVLRATGEVHQTRLYGRHLSIRRTIETGMDEKVIRIHDTVTNFESEDEPYMLLYHFNFGYPLLQADSLVKVSDSKWVPTTPLAEDPFHMTDPINGRGDELFLYTDMGDHACGVLYNERLELGAYVSWDTANLPNMVQWKKMKSQDYVLAMEPTNTFLINRTQASAENKISVLPAYSSVETHLELGVLDGLQEIREFIANL